MSEFKAENLASCIKDRKTETDKRLTAAIDQLVADAANITREQLNALVKVARESENMIGYLTAIDDLATDELKSDYVRFCGYKEPSFKDSHVEDRTVRFNNESIIITDPCYVIPPNIDNSEVELTDHGFDMTKAGYTKCCVEHNGYGDGSWKVVNVKNMNTLGEIWADSGQVGVFLLDEVAAKCLSANIGGAVILKGFTGEVTFHMYEAAESLFPEDDLVTASYLILTVRGKTSDGEDVQFTIDYGKCDDVL